MCRSDMPDRGDYKGQSDETACCDNVWLPSMKIRNVDGTLTDRDQYYSIYFSKDDDNVGYQLNLQGTFFSPMHFAKFPFDSQVLEIHFTQSTGFLDSVEEYIPSATTTRWFQRGAGDVAPGWELKDVEIEGFNTSLSEMVQVYTSQYGKPFHANDSHPLAGKDGTISEIIDGVANKDFCILIKIDRYWNSYLLTMVLPLIFLNVLLFCTFFIPPQDAMNIRTRMFVVIFLSITSLNFAVSGKLPASSYTTGIEELLLYCYAIAAIATPQAVFVGALEVNARQKQSAAQQKERKSKETLGFGEQIKSALSKDKPADPEEGKHSGIPLAFGNSGNGASSGKSKKAKQNNTQMGEMFLRALSAHYNTLVTKPSEQIRFDYVSRAAKYIDRITYYTMLTVTLIMYILFFVQGSVGA